LLCHARGSLRFDALSQSFLPDRLPSGFRVMGSAAGLADLGGILASAAKDSMGLCAELGFSSYHVHQPQITQSVIESGQTGTADLHPAKQRQWIDLAHDVTFADAQLAVREGYDLLEHFKRYTTTGMSVDQGKTGNLNAFLALSSLTGSSIDGIGTTTFRPPYTPVTLGAIAGRNQGEFYAPRRYLPAHRIHQRLQGHFEDYGGWQRPDWYPQPGETPQASIARETRAVRTGVGIFDNSPIGKIEVRGPHAAEFLNRIYLNNVHNLAVGRARYGLMLNENGVIIDDGVFSRLADDHFLVNTTSGGVARIMALFEEWLQCEWTGLRVLVDDVTPQWANFTFAGPRARDLLQKLGTGIDLSPAALPHMSVRSGQLAGETVRLVRVSFSGEASYEVNLPANRGGSFLARALHQGAEFAATPYGIEALMTLRLEKGYLHVGSDTDGVTTPDDVGWGPAARNKQADFIGKRSLYRPANLDPNRKQLVGLLALDKEQRIQAGGHLLLGASRHAPAATDGWITSAAWSPNLGRYIALAMLRAGRNQQGAVLSVIDDHRTYPVKVVATPFWDRENERLKI
jgi:sarcosine oxidase subunit alpha